MAYDIFSQLQGPQIDINLFPSAATAGINAGNALPTKLTSAITGFTKGVQTGQQIVENYQESEIRQNQIDQLPVQNRIQEAQAENSETVAQINKLKLEAAQQLETLDLEAQRSQLELTKADAADKANLIKSRNEFNDAFAAADPATQAQMVLGGQYAGLFNRDPKFYTQQLQNIYANRNRNGIDPETADRIGQILKVRGIVSEGDKLAAKYQNAYDAAKANVEASTWASQVSDKLGTTSVDAAEKVQFVPHGMYEVKNGMLITDTGYSPGSGIFKQSQEYAAGGGAELAKGKWDIIDPETGTVIDNTGTIGDAEYKQWADYNAKKKLVDQTYTNRKLSEVTGGGKPKIVNPKIFTPRNQTQAVADTTQTTETLSNVINNKIVTNLKLAPEYKELLYTPSEMLTSYIESYIKNPESRTSATSQDLQNRAIRMATRIITDKELAANPELAAKYTQKDADDYNTALKESMFGYSLMPKPDIFGTTPLNIIKSGLSKSETMSGLQGSGYSKVQQQLYDAYKVETPQDLYFANRYAIISNTIKDVVNEALRTASSSATTSTNSHQVIQKNSAYVSGVAKNGPAAIGQ